MGGRRNRRYWEIVLACCVFSEGARGRGREIKQGNNKRVKWRFISLRYLSVTWVLKGRGEMIGMERDPPEKDNQVQLWKRKLERESSESETPDGMGKLKEGRDRISSRT